ncbi:membrane protein [Betaproteobacteria bacterium]|nr:membrane protein [Betaproteobacteria bacterium]
MIGILIKAMDRLNAFVKYVLGLALIVMSIVTVLQVFCRFVLHASLPWSEELTRYLMVYIGFWGTGYAMRHNLLMRVDVVEQFLPKKHEVAYLLLLNLFLIFIFICVGWAGMNMYLGGYRQVSAALRMPMAYVYFSIPSGAVLMILNTLAGLHERITPKTASGSGEKIPS